MLWVYPLCSLVPLVVYALIVGMWQRPHRTGWTTDLTGVLFGAELAVRHVRCDAIGAGGCQLTVDVINQLLKAGAFHGCLRASSSN